MSKKGLRVTEVLVILLVIIVGGLLGLNAIRDAWLRATEAESLAICAGNLKQWASVLAMYADESKGGCYPPIWTQSMVAFALDPAMLHPQYVHDLGVFRCPSGLGGPIDSLDTKYVHPEDRRALQVNVLQNYAYFGWVFDRTADLPAQCVEIGNLPPALAATPTVTSALASRSISKQSGGVCAQMALTLDAVLNRPPCVDEDVTLETPHGNMGGKTVHRFRKGVEHLLIADTNPSTDAVARQAGQIPVMMDSFSLASAMAIFNHMPGGSNVLYLDGHVDFWKYPAGSGPVTRPVGRLLSLLLQ
jgi:prepilin-type processing-associated H-X9-DG protein